MVAHLVAEWKKTCMYILFAGSLPFLLCGFFSGFLQSLTKKVMKLHGVVQCCAGDGNFLHCLTSDWVCVWAPVMCCSWRPASPPRSDLSLFLIEFFLYVSNTRSILSPSALSFNVINETLIGSSLEVMWSFLTLGLNSFHQSLNHWPGNCSATVSLSHSSAKMWLK